MIRRWTPFALGVLIAIVGAALPTPAGADQWTPSYPGPNQIAVSVSDAGNDGVISAIEGQIISTNSALDSQDLCTAYESTGDCEFGAPGEAAAANITLPVCSTTTQTNCIVSLELGTSVTTMQPATFIRSTLGATTPALSAYNLPEGSTIRLWQSSVANAAESTTYAAAVTLQYFFESGKFEPATLQAAIFLNPK